MSQGFGKGVISLNARYNRQILLSAINLDTRYHLALRAQQTTFSYYDLFTDKRYSMRTQVVQSKRVYHVNSFEDIGITDHQIKKNKQYARVDCLPEVLGLYQLMVNYNHMTVDLFNPEQTKEIAGVIYGLSHMGQYLQKESEKWDRAHYPEEHGIHLSDDEMGLIIMFLRDLFSNRKNSLSIRMDAETFRISFIKMITNQIPLNLSTDDAKELLLLMKREGNAMFKQLDLSADELKFIYHDIIHDLNEFIHPMTIAGKEMVELGKSIQIARHHSIRKALDYIFRECKFNDDNTRVFSRTLISDVALHVTSDNFNNGKTFLLIKVAIANVKRTSDNDSKQTLSRLKELKRKGFKYITSHFINNGKSVRINPVTRRDFDILINEMKREIGDMDY